MHCVPDGHGGSHALPFFSEFHLPGAFDQAHSPSMHSSSSSHGGSHSNFARCRKHTPIVASHCSQSSVHGLSANEWDSRIRSPARITYICKSVAAGTIPTVPYSRHDGHRSFHNHDYIHTPPMNQSRSQARDSFLPESKRARSNLVEILLANNQVQQRNSTTGTEPRALEPADIDRHLLGDVRPGVDTTILFSAIAIAAE